MATTRPEPNAPSDARVPEKKQRNPWIWVCALLAVVAAGLLIWALSVQSDLDTTQKQVNDLQAEVDRSQSAGGQLVAAAKGVVDDLSAQLGATSDDLEQTQQDLTGRALETDGLVVRVAELLLEHAVDVLGLLLLLHLGEVLAAGVAATGAAVLAWREGATIERLAALFVLEDVGAEATRDAHLRSGVASHVLSFPLIRADQPRRRLG